MYYTHFGLTEAPFSIAPNPAYLFMTERHQEALAHLYHGIESDAGFVLLTGDIGTGKTTVCRRFLHHLPQHTQVAFILNPCVDRIELLQAIAKELQIPNSENEAANLCQLTDDLHEYLLDNHAKGINTVLLVDEAQQIQPPVLEFIRLLTNLETDKQKLLKIILVGQPELNDILAQPAMVQLSQRITARYHIYPLTINEITNYINHRLHVAGYTQGRPLFSARRIKQLFAMTKGVPRLINVICDRALLGAYSQSATTVGGEVLTKAYREVSGNYIASPSLHSVSRWAAPARLLVSTFCIAALIAISLVLWFPKVTHFPLSFFDTIYPIKKYPVNNADVNQDVNGSQAPNDKMLTLIELPVAIPEIQGNASTVIDEFMEGNDSSNTEPKLKVSSTTIVNVTGDVAVIENVDAPIKKDSEAMPVVSYYENKQDALAALMRYAIPQALPLKTRYQQECERLHLLQFRCETVRESSWQALKKYNRPAVIALRNNSRLSHVVVVDIDEDYVVVQAESIGDLQHNNKLLVSRLSISEIEQQWDGELTFIWHAPLGTERFIFRESNAALINWLAQAFATIDQRNDVLAKDKYNNVLEKRIRLFQKKYALKEDGKAGMETLLKLNELLGIAMPLDGKVAIVNSVADQ
jgi:general secretion pathway protein A